MIGGRLHILLRRDFTPLQGGKFLVHLAVALVI